MVQDVNRKNRYAFLRCFFACILLNILSAFLMAKFGGNPFEIGGLRFQISTINGCIQVIIFIICIFMIFISPKKGLWSSVIVIGLSIAGAAVAVFAEKSLNALPGVLSCLLFMLAIYIIAKQYMRSEEKAVTDENTGIPNAVAFENDVNTALLYNKNGYILFIHLDGFLSINSNLGRDSGNEILRVIAKRLVDTFSDRAKVFKIDGAEYAMIIPETENAVVLSNQVISTIEEPVILNKDDIVTNFYLTAYVGIEPFFAGDTASEELFKSADIAMNYAIKSGETKVSTFNAMMREQIERDANIEQLVKDSIKNGYLYLVYQPQFTTVDRHLKGYEALDRMSTPDGIPISPREFIPIAERSELILDIDEYVLRRAMAEFKSICYDSYNTITLAINVSAKDIAREDFADRVLGLIHELRFPAECLEIEITEYSLANAQSHTIDNIRKLRERQVMVAIDDFGTGYTSLEQLMRLPINLVKLDKSLIDDIAEKKLNSDFVRSVIYMGHLMDAEVLAEGVEKEEQLEKLREVGCDYIQGYLWGKPMEYENARTLSGS